MRQYPNGPQNFGNLNIFNFYAFYDFYSSTLMLQRLFSQIKHICVQRLPIFTRFIHNFDLINQKMIFYS